MCLCILCVCVCVYLLIYIALVILIPVLMLYNTLCCPRRPTFTPDGLLLITPMGIYHPITANTSNTPASANINPGVSYCTHVYSRGCFTAPHIASTGGNCCPIYSLVGLDEPSVAVRCNPRLFYPMNEPDGNGPAAKYRYLTYSMCAKYLHEFYTYTYTHVECYLP